MLFEDLPLWSQWGIFGVSMALNIFFLAQYIRGELVNRKQVDVIERVGQTYLKAWEISENTKQGHVEVLNKLLTSSDTQLQILNALKDSHLDNPKGQSEGGGSDVVS